MTSHLKVECASHCTTPSERPDDYPVAVKVGCFHVNPATPRGRRKFLLQMLVLCFVPHAALIIQNSTIMAQLSQTLDSALYLNSEVETNLALDELVLALQEERLEATDFLFQDTRSYKLNRSKVEKSFSATDALFDNVSSSIVKDSLKITLYVGELEVAGQPAHPPYLTYYQLSDDNMITVDPIFSISDLTEDLL